MDAGRQAAADKGAARAQDTEDYPGAHPYTVSTQVGGHAHERGDADDDERGGRRAMRAHAEQVDQRGHGQDRPAAAEGAEAESDQDPDRQGEQHDSPQARYAPGLRISSGCLAFTVGVQSQNPMRQ